MGITLAVLAILIVGAVVGSALNFMSVFLGIPIVFLFIGGVIGKEIMERQQRILRLKRFRRDRELGMTNSARVCIPFRTAAGNQRRSRSATRLPA